ncbi:VOC family protein [Couchioplanes caeruleus]|uniref:VOC family protein n=1 Tax=Couchioplanes caeruleus TaxID=56438 RepID=UPI0020C09CE6|nr:VOC family protein [Couchioplanes caeruleus]UQU66997.1 VOC family protein [Couchioplanes caeruleus]
MTSRIAQWTLDVQDVDVMARFWSAVLGYRINRGGDGNAKLYPPDDAPGAPPVWLQASAGPKSGKNRTHPDLVVTGGEDQAAEVDRLLSLGARRADVGQTGDEGFTVLADPEGNEFCVLRGQPG